MDGPKAKPLTHSYGFHPNCNSVQGLKIMLAALSSSIIVPATFLYE